MHTNHKTHSVLLSVLLWALSFLTPTLSAQVLIPMDESQQRDHLKAYGLLYNAIEDGYDCHWLLNYRGGSFAILNADSKLIQQALLRGVSYETSSAAQLVQLMADLKSPAKNTNTVALQRVPKIAVYSPDGAQPWDDAVTMVLEYADIPFTTIYDTEVLDGSLGDYQWLHLHHEDFTGQYGKFYGSYRDAAWYINQKASFEAAAIEMGFPKVSQQKLAVAKTIATFVENGGFLFAMCSATDSYDIALAAQKTDICES
ncbi:MAG: asparagine synthetase B, partial [Flavobacteriaceae bacterium]|nr:asparagine synthetase B [Flavobacteriaceae bacterium]